MTSTEILPFFKVRIAQLQKEKEESTTQVRWLSFLRFITFVLYLVVLVYLSNQRLFTPSIVLTLFFILIFGTLVRWHLKAKFKLSQLEYLFQLNHEEILRWEGKLHDLPSGNAFLQTEHPYAPDLDIFGSNSLYQLLVRSRLGGTRNLLSEWMLNSASQQEILDRQEAIEELKSLTEWRQDITALGMTHHKEGKNPVSMDQLSSWLKNHLRFVDKPIWAILEILMPLMAVVFVLGFWLFDWPYQFFFIPVLVNLYLLKVIFVPLSNLTKGFEGIHQVLESYGRIIRIVEQKEFKAPLLKKQSQQLLTQKEPASKSIKQLTEILYFLQNRINMVYQGLNIIFLFDLIVFRRALSWKKKYEEHLHLWLEAIHQIDALSDLSSFAFANPSFVWPKIKGNGHTFSARDMGHPLIKSDQRIYNHFSIATQGELALITGSNMSGKSTFLRTLGVNLVLAQMGAPVCALSLEFSLMQVFTSMRTQDNLEENASSFYAELKRIKLLLDSLNQEKPIFYLLDEILKGTNSEDRHKGAISLIDQLTHLNCLGMISTHDIQLAELSKKDTKITNYSFNSTIQGDEIIFDYQLTDGPCRSFNASKLMEKMGIIKKQ